MATENNTIQTKVTLDATQAQQEIVRLNAVAADSTKTLEERVAAKNKQLELTEKLNKKEIASLTKKVKSLQGVKGKEMELEKATKKLNTTRIKTLKQETNLIKSSNSLTKKLQGSKGAVNKLDNATGGLIKSFFALAANPIVAVITVLVGLFTLLKKAFTSSEEGQDKWNKAMTVASTILGNLMDIIADVAEKLVWMFTHPREALNTFAETIKRDITTRIEGLMELIPKLGAAITLVFSGKFKEAGKVAVDAMGKVALGVDSVTESVALAGEALDGFIEEQKREAAIASDIADKRAKANKLDTQLILERSKANQKRADLLNKSEDKANFNAKQRAEFLKQASKLEEEITKKEIASAKLRFDAKALENTLSRSTLEDKQEEAQLQAKLIDLDTKRLKKEKLITTKLVSFNNEISAAAKKRADAEAKAQEKIAETRRKEIEGFQKAIEEREQLEREAKQRKEKQEAEDAERARMIKLDEAQRDMEAQNEIDALEIERKTAAGENTLQLELDLLQRKRDQELANTELTAKEKLAIEQEFQNATNKLNVEAAERSKKSDQQMLESSINLAAESFGVSKEAAIAMSLIKAPEAIQNVWAEAGKKPTLPQVLLHGIGGTAMVVAPIVKSLSTIKKTKMKGKAGSKTKGSSGGGSISVPGTVTSSVDDLSANNAANIAGESGLNNSATAAAAANVAGNSSNNIVFQEGQYNDFQDQVNFVEGQTTID